MAKSAEIRGNELNLFQVEGAEDDKSIFYTALTKCFVNPQNLNEDFNRTYLKNIRYRSEALALNRTVRHFRSAREKSCLQPNFMGNRFVSTNSFWRFVTSNTSVRFAHFYFFKSHCFNLLKIMAIDSGSMASISISFKSLTILRVVSL